MNLKSAMRGDLSTFVNLEEFAEFKNLNGYELAIIETFTFGSAQGNYSNREGITFKRHGANFIGESLVIYFKTRDYPLATPKSTEFVTYCGKRYRVTEAQVMEGITRLTLNVDSMQTARG